MAHEEKHEASHGADHGHDEEHFAHALPVSKLVGVWVALMILTVLTVWASRQGLGSQASFTVAMIIATVKALMVGAVFMHLWWDKRLNLLAFGGCFLFVMLFIGMALTDKSEYKPDVDRKTADDMALSGGK